MGFLTGLGRGIGAAASGLLGGQIAGEKENYRRDQIALDREAKAEALKQQRELVGLRRKELDPRKAQVDTAHQLLAGITSESLKPEYQAYRLKYHDFDSHIAGVQRHLTNVIKGTEDLDPDKIAWLTALEHPGEALGGAGGDPIPGLGGDGGITPAAGLGGSQGPPPPPVNQPLVLSPDQLAHGGGPQGGPPLVTAPANDGVPIGPSIGPPIPQSMYRPPQAKAKAKVQEAPAAAVPEPAPAAPQTQTEKFAKRYFDLLSQGPPKIAPELGVTDKAYRDAQREARTEWTAETDRMERSLKVLPDAEFKRLRALYAPSEHLSLLDTRGATADKAREDIRVSQKMTPLKAGKLKSETDYTTTKTKQLPKELSLRERTVATGERGQAETARHNPVMERLADFNSKTQRAAQLSLAELRKATMARLKFVTDHFDELQLRQDQRARITALGRMAQGSISAFGMKAPTGDAKVSLDKLNKELDAIPSRGAAPAAGSLKAPAAAPTGGDSIPKEALAHVKGIIGNGTFANTLATLKKRNPSDAQMLLRAYKTLKGRDWAGK